MFKKTIKFEDFNGDEVEKDFYFHWAKADLMRMAVDGSFEKRVKSIMASRDSQKIMREFEQILRSAVGVRSEDGQRFIKDQAAQSALFDSPAYDVLMFDLLTDPKLATEFIANLMPKEMGAAMRKELEKVETGEVPSPFGGDPLSVDPEDTRPAYIREDRAPTPQELRNMTQAELQAAFARRGK